MMKIEKYFGVPLGAIGTGKINFYPDLTIDDITIMNNWSNPLRRIRGFHIVTFMDKEPIFLQTNPGKNVETPPRYTYVKELEMNVEFPVIRYLSPLADIEVYSILIKNDIKNSSLPVIKFKIKGKGKFAISFPNIVGSKRAGRVNIAYNGKINGVLMKNERASVVDPAYGEIFLGCVGCEIITNFAYYKPAKIGMTEDITYFYDLKEYTEKYTIKPYAREEIGGIVYKEIDGEDTFILSWYFNGRPHHYPYGHYYENFFNDSIDVAEYALALEPDLGIDEKEEWLRDSLTNSLYILTSNTWLTKDGRFAVYEDPYISKLMNTIGSMTFDGLGFTLLQLYRDLIINADTYFINYVNKGETPHDIGEESIEDPIYGASYPYWWTDLGPTLILMLYRDYLFTSRREILESNYDKIKEIIDWLMKKDLDNDCIPDSKGGYDNSYDGTHMYGASSYVASMFLCALTAFIRISEILDIKIEDKYFKFLECGKKTFDSLWNGNYFILWKRKYDENRSCLNSQLLGQFWCDILGLPSITDDVKINTALKSIYELNFKASKYCLSNAVREDGSIDTSTGQLRSCWPRVSFAIASHMILRGMVKEGLEIAKREWNTIKDLNPFDQSSRIDAIDGKYVGLMSYIGSTSIWLVKLALDKISSF
ncbi:GH116 family glycosyl hydrolase [Sulfolobus tengchongensis]|uniref:GH116 family glycosyl hydrolase n=1 Tax=Sulfolobus tengchongensis TaxID=207809 RepID=A0AAX4L4D0_9CREN